MIDTLLSLVAPHPCCSCGRIGAVLCEYCNYDIVSEVYSQCLSCGAPAGELGVCRRCRVPYSRAWCVGERTGVLQRLIGMYKFQYIRSAHRSLGDILLARLPELPDNTVVVPVPTVAAHIRERGFDHMALVARHVARRRNLVVDTPLRRRTTTMQRHATSGQRQRQAKQAFAVRGTLQPVPHLLIDDVVTTGATIRYASQTLLDAGASEVWVAAISRQVLD